MDQKVFRVIETTIKKIVYEVVATDEIAAEKAIGWFHSSAWNETVDVRVLDTGSSNVSYSATETTSTEVCPECSHFLKHHGPDGCNWNCDCKRTP